MKTDKVAILIKKAALEFDKMANPSLDKFGISSAQYKVMKYIYNEYEDGVRLVDLEKYFSMTHPTAIGLVNNLEKSGYVEYKNNPNNARSRYIYPTKKALKKKEELDKVGEMLEDEMTKNLSKKEREELIDLLVKMLGVDNG